jgi:serine/threonine protein kinase, bacterial
MSLNLYPIIKQLGNGGFGKTFLATNTLMPSRPYCVVKQLIPTSTEPHLQTLIQERFQKEGLVLESLGEQSNGMIPKLYAYFMEAGEFYLVQEYISGQTLLDRVKSNGLFTEMQVRQLLTDILPILTYVHSRGMVHRDIKPDNVMLREDSNKPVLIDFGAVKETMSTVMTMSGNTGRSIVIGTPGFMPAEQVSGRPMFVSDIYALGLTIIYLLTGKMPGEMEADPSTGNINWQAYAPNISSQLATVLNTAIHPIPTARYSSAQDMLQALSTATPIPVKPSDIPGSQSAATVVTPMPTAYQPAYTSPQTQYIATPPTEIKSQNNPLLAAVIGVVIGGGLIAGGLLLGKNFTENSSEKTSSKSGSSEKIDNKSSSSNEKAGEQQSSNSQGNNNGNSTNNNRSNNNNNDNNRGNNNNSNSSNNGSNNNSGSSNNKSAISREAAAQVLNQWLMYKRVLLAPPYDKQQGANILYGKAYRDNIDKSSESCSGRDPDDCLSSVDWLMKYNAQYSFGVQRVDSIDRFEANGDTGTIFATITEFRTLHKTGGRVTPSGGTKQARYDLKYDNGKVKISDYKVLN